MVGHDIATEHGVLPNRGSEYMIKLRNSLILAAAAAPVRTDERGGRHDCQGKACGTKWQRR